MTEIKLGYEPKNRYKWIQLPNDYEGDTHNDKMVVKVHQRLWEKVKNVMRIQKKGWDAVILIDGARRSGKSTLAKIIAYLINPDLTIDNYVSGMGEAPDKIEKTKDEDPLIFDEGSLVANSKNAMSKLNVQLEQIIDVCGVKRLVMIFCMPTFFSINRTIAVTHSRFLLHVYTDDDLQRGFFLFFGTKAKRRLYSIGKKNNHSYSSPPATWNGRFSDFHVPFEEEYLKLKKQSLKEALNPNAKKEKEIPQDVEMRVRDKLMLNFIKNCPEIQKKVIAKGFGVTRMTINRKENAIIGGNK